jgi:inner membrane protein
MASLGHVIIGVAASRVESRAGGPELQGQPKRRRLRAAAGWAMLSMLPDVDVIGFWIGLRYEDEWGHRGATHSFAFALIVAAAIAMLAPLFGRRRLRTGVLAAIVLASHSLLDTLTDGGLGCALFWPFDLTRYFAPWRPIPVAPIAFDFLSAEGLAISIVEIVMFAPLLWLAIEYARRSDPRHRTRWSAIRLGTASAALIAIVAVALRQSARERAIGWLVREDIVYGAGYSDERFNNVAVGDAIEAVRSVLGPPVRELFYYSAAPAPPSTCAVVQAEHHVIVSATNADACRA